MLEVLIAAALSLVLLTVAAMWLTSGSRTLHQIGLRGELFSGASLALLSVEREAQQTALQGIQSSPDGTQTSIQPLQGWTAEGRVRWQPSLTIFRHEAATGDLHRDSVDLTNVTLTPAYDPVAPLFLPGSGVQTMSAQRSSTRLLARNVAFWELALTGNGSPLNAEIEVRFTEPAGVRRRYRVQRSFFVGSAPSGQGTPP